MHRCTQQPRIELCLQSTRRSAPPASLPFRFAVAGLQGVREGLNLPPPVELDPGSLTDTQRRAAGIRQLPATLEEAIEAYDSDKGQ